MLQQHQHAVVVRAAVRHALHFPQQLFVVATIRFRFSGIARGIYAGRSAQRADTDTRIIGQRRQSAQTADMPRFGERILDEGHVRFLGFGYAELRLGKHLDTERLQQELEFAQLAGIVGSDD